MESKIATTQTYHSFPMAGTDLMMKVHLTLETRDGVPVVEIANGVKVDRAAGPCVSFNTIRMIEKHLDLLVIAPFISAVGDYVQRSMEGRLRPEAPLDGVGPSAAHSNVQDEVEAAKDRLKPRAPWGKGPGSSHNLDTCEPVEPKTGFFERSAV